MSLPSDSPVSARPAWPVPGLCATEHQPIDGDPVGPRCARVKGDGHTVERVREDGSLDWYTVHLTKRGARRAAALYERTGKVRGGRP